MPKSTQRTYNRAKNIVTFFSVPFKGLIEYSGLENIIEEGPNLIIANHPGVGKDIGSLLHAYDRQLCFTASDFLFEKETILSKAKEYLGEKKYSRLEPLANYLAGFLSRKMNEFDMIPIPWEYNGNSKETAKSLRKSMDKAKDYLRQGKAAVFFQIAHSLLTENGTEENKIKAQSKYHNYLFKFNNTVLKIANELRKEGIIVPIAPIAFFGGETLNPFERIKMSIGKPVYIEDSIYGNTNPGNNSIVPELTNMLEKTVADMLIEMNVPEDINLLDKKAKRKLMKN
jgi:hypothetical protein